MMPTIKESLDLLNAPGTLGGIRVIWAGGRDDGALALLADPSRIHPSVAYDTLRRSGYSPKELDAFWRERGDFDEIPAIKNNPQPPPEKRFNRGPVVSEADYDPRLKWKSCCE